jgi:hypothetical protein
MHVFSHQPEYKNKNPTHNLAAQNQNCTMANAGVSVFEE